MERLAGVVPEAGSGPQIVLRKQVRVGKAGRTHQVGLGKRGVGITF